MRPPLFKVKIHVLVFSALLVVPTGLALLYSKKYGQTEEELRQVLVRALYSSVLLSTPLYSSLLLSTPLYSFLLLSTPLNFFSLSSTIYRFSSPLWTDISCAYEIKIEIPECIYVNRTRSFPSVPLQIAKNKKSYKIFSMPWKMKRKKQSLIKSLMVIIIFIEELTPHFILNLPLIILIYITMFLTEVLKGGKSEVKRTAGQSAPLRDDEKL